MELVIPYCGAPNGEAIAHSIKKHHKDVTLIGADSNPDCDNRWLFDEFYTVPSTGSKIYSNVVEDFFKNCDFILPLNGYDAVALKKTSLRDKVLATDDCNTMLNVMDKDYLYNTFHMKHATVYADELLETVMYYMTLYDSAVVKVQSGRGTRGVFIVADFDDMKNRVYHKPGVLDMSYPVFERMVNTTSLNKKFIVMPYYEGTEFFVNALCRNGEVEWMQTIQIDGKRDHVASKFKVVEYDIVDDKAISICKRFKFDYWVNLQFIDENLIEINPRISSWVAHPDYSVPYLAVRMALGEDINKVPRVKIGTVGRRIFQMYYMEGMYVY